jgi:pimeloyl-ACP methyl ester carboxylesterase
MQLHHLDVASRAGAGTGAADGDREAAVLVLLHGGTETAEACWGPSLEGFSSRYRVIAPDSRGHGATVNEGNRPLSYRLMAEDVAELCASLGVERAAFCGFSDGANIILELAMAMPELVGAGVLHGTVVDFTETYFTGLRGFFGVDDLSAPADPDAMEAAHPGYVQHLRRWHRAQGSEHWRHVIAMVQPLFTGPLHYDDSDYARATTPLLVLTGDGDEFQTVEQQAALCRRLPDAELAVMPGVGHGFPADRSLHTHLVLDFLDRRYRRRR